MNHNAALKVLPWAGPGTLSPAALAAHTGPVVLAIATPDTSIRDTARALTRTALREALGVLLACPPQEVALISHPGSPIRLELPGSRVGLSVSHEPGLSLAAIQFGGAVGIDLMRIDRLPDWLSDWETMARDYLGPQAVERIARHPSQDQAHAFAREWTRLEACLKCHDMQLQEWSPALERKLMRCRVFGLALPDAFIATLALCA